MTAERAATTRTHQDILLPYEMTSMTGADPRAYYHKLGRAVASDLDTFWQRARHVVGDRVDVVDMFSGCGGVSAGFKAINGAEPIFRHILAIDVNDNALESCQRNVGVRTINADIAALSQDIAALDTLMREAGRNEDNPLVLIGCAPCQGFSSHRNDLSGEDVRNSLFVDFARIAVHLQPDVVVIENVPELCTTKYWAHVKEARGLLEAAGYHVHLSIHNMAEYGVPQERFRALLLAMRRPFAPLEGFLSRAEFRTVRQAIGALPPVEPGIVSPSDPMHYTAGHQQSTVETIRAIPKDGGSRPDHVGPESLRRAKERTGKAAFEDVYGRLYWDRPAITITAHSRNPASGRFVHPEQDRGLSVREAALLQGFPRDYEFAGGLDKRFLQIGNAVPPTFAAYLAAHVLGELLSAEPFNGEVTDDVTVPVGTSFSRLIPALKAGRRGVLTGKVDAKSKVGAS